MVPPLFWMEIANVLLAAGRSRGPIEAPAHIPVRTLTAPTISGG